MVVGSVVSRPTEVLVAPGHASDGRARVLYEAIAYLVILWGPETNGRDRISDGPNHYAIAGQRIGVRTSRPVWPSCAALA